MRIATYVAAILCMLVGVIWILQGINVLPGSFMTGQPKWAVYGCILLVIGIAIAVWTGRRQP